MNENEISKKLNPVIDRLKVEADNALTGCEKMIDLELSRVRNFTPKNLDELLKMIFQNCSDISELDATIEYLAQNINKNKRIIERMNVQRELTKEDIIDENIFNIFGMYGGSVLATYLFSSNPLEFTKNFLVFTLIGIATFKINLDYFTGSYRKKQISDYLIRLTKTIEIDDFNITVLKKMRIMCVGELQYEVIKLYQIINKKNNRETATRKLEELIKGMGLETIVDSKNIKVLTRKK